MASCVGERQAVSILIEGRPYTIGDPVVSNGRCGVPRGIDGIIVAISERRYRPIKVHFVKRPEAIWVEPEDLINTQPP